MRNHSKLLPGLSLRPVDIDDVAAVRHVHAAATRACAEPYLGKTDLENMSAAIYREDYIDAIVKGELTGAWVGRELVGTVGWRPGSGKTLGGQLQMLFVWPMFARAGIGRLLVSHAEAEAYEAGLRSMRVRTATHQAVFFKRLGYVISAQSAIRTESGARFPVAFLRKDEIFPEFPITESEWGGPGRHYRH